MCHLQYMKEVVCIVAQSYRVGLNLENTCYNHGLKAGVDHISLTTF